MQVVSDISKVDRLTLSDPSDPKKIPQKGPMQTAMYIPMIAPICMPGTVIAAVGTGTGITFLP